jgi:O-antigen ligase
VGFVFLFFALRAGGRVRLVAGGLAVLTVLGVTTAVLQPETFDSVVTRAAAVSAYSTDPSVQYRFIENRAVLAQWREHPLQGKGLGTQYLFDFSRFNVKPVYKVYVHNNYYWFLQRMGLIGIGLFAWMMIAFLYSGYRARAFISGDDPWLSGLVVGSRVMIVALLVVSISSPQFNTKGGVAIAALVMAMAEVAGSLLRGGQGGGGSDRERGGGGDGEGKRG